jgi:hypothetical protein
MTAQAGVCPICHEYYPRLTEHHIHKRMVFGRSKKNGFTIHICDYCHIEVEGEVTRRENIVLRQHKKDIYEDTINAFVNGRIEIEHPKRGKYHR